MFKWKICISQGIGDREKEVEMEFDNEEDFHNFISRNLSSWEVHGWTSITWGDTFFDIQEYLQHVMLEEERRILDGTEDDLILDEREDDLVKIEDRLEHFFATIRHYLGKYFIFLQ